jgi:cyclic-di-AMP phosphodiesterase PgpH
VIPRHRVSRRPDQFTGQHVVHAILFAVFTTVAVSLLLVANLLPRVHEYREGEVSQTNIKSPNKLTFISQVRTRAERDRAAAAVQDVLEIDISLMARQQQGLRALVQNISSTRSSLPAEQRREAIKRLAAPPFSDASASLLSTLDDARLAVVFQESQRLLLEAMRERVSEARAQELIRQLPSMTSEQLSEPERGLVVDLTSRFVRSNLVVNQERTAQLREEVRQAVAPVQVTIESGEIVLREGEIVTSADLEKLEALGLRNPTADWRGAAAGAMLVFVLVAVLAGYVYAFQPAVMTRDKRLLLLSVVMIVVVLAAKLVVPGRPLWVYVFPLPAVAMLLATLLDARLAIFISGLLSVLVAYIGGGALEYAVMFIAACSAAAIAVWRRERGQAFFVAGVFAALAQFATVVTFMLANRADDWSLSVLIAFECLVNGLGSAILAAGGGILLGRLFGITTTWQLLELANPTHPLLRRLMNEAPGTYHHSLIVGNLAERSAEEVGADPLLARVASYYHDVGKLRRPYFFIENQADGVNAHDSLEPSESARIIAAHVTDGVELAERYGLPTRVRELIPQHHGTRLVSFFYDRAAHGWDGEARLEDFSYPGPKPQSKEAAIVMLADSVEAAARASRDHSPEAIRSLVDKIFLQRLSEGQLDECDLALRDLQRIKESFYTLLIGMYHPRIEYPERSPDTSLVQPSMPALPSRPNDVALAEDAPATSQP